jgi:hypothetical protein
MQEQIIFVGIIMLVLVLIRLASVVRLLALAVQNLKTELFASRNNRLVDDLTRFKSRFD